MMMGMGMREVGVGGEAVVGEGMDGLVVEEVVIGNGVVVMEEVVADGNVTSSSFRSQIYDYMPTSNGFTIA